MIVSHVLEELGTASNPKTSRASTVLQKISLSFVTAFELQNTVVLLSCGGVSGSSNFIFPKVYFRTYGIST